MTRPPMRRRLAALLTSTFLVVAGAASAHADLIVNNVDGTVDSTVESLPLNPGGTATVAMRLIEANDDSKQGCNLTGQTTLVVNVNNSTPATATVTPSTLTFDSCAAVPKVTVTALAQGAATISLSVRSNDTKGTFDLAPATFMVTVAPPPNTPPTVTVGGVTDLATYTYGSVPPATCSATDAEDGTAQPTPTYGAIVGPNAAYGIGTQQVTCTYTDKGGLTASMSATYTITQATSTTTVTCVPTSVVYTGEAQEPCTATVTGAGGLNTTTQVSYGNNTNVGTATADATYAGDPAHTASTAPQVTFAITKATSTVTVSCSDATYDGTEQKPCSAVAEGIGLTPITLTPTYTNNIDAGPATAKAGWDGDANHTGATGEANFTIGKATSTTTLSCPTEVEYTGSALEPCTATVTGASLTGITADVTYASNTDVGTARANSTWPGDGNHNGSTADEVTFSITKAPSAVQVTCETGPFVYNGSAFDPCTANVTGIGGLDQSAPVTYSPDSVNAGEVTATGTYGGDSNHAGSEGTGSFTILKANSTVVVSCPDGPFVFDGDAKAPCTARVTGAGGLDESVDVTYTANVHAGPVTVSASYAGDSNHNGSDDSTSFVIAKASSSVTVTCTDVTYDGTAQTPCTATASGVAMADVPVTVSYTNNTDAGTATATASWIGDADHEGSSDTKTFTIAPAKTVTKLTCPASVVYAGEDRKPCSATVTGPGGLDHSVAVNYENNLLVGTATATAAYLGTNNYLPSDDQVTFEITQAASQVLVTCDPTTVTYTGAAQTPCSAVAQGVGMPDLALTPGYTNNVNAGTATAAASWEGDRNHVGSEGSTTFTIAKATTSIALTCPTSVVFTGSAVTPCTATVTGAGGLSQSLTVGYTANTAVGTATATATYAGDGNHLGSTKSATFTIASWTLKGFYQPVDMNGVWNTVKNGSTVPLKFQAYSGSTEITTTSQLGATFTVKGVACPGSGAVTDSIELTTTGATSLRYDSTGGQFIQNWQTPKKPGACYQVTMTAADGSSLTANFILR